MPTATNGTRAIWLTLLIAFAALNVWALASAGWDGLVSYFTTMGPIDLVAAVDLILALLIGIVLVARNATDRSINPRPFVLLTLLGGSLGLLGYLARHGLTDPDQRQASDAATPRTPSPRPIR
jgi:hypothetical protein